jgi:hypothetical protein
MLMSFFEYLPNWYMFKTDVTEILVSILCAFLENKYETFPLTYA